MALALDKLDFNDLAHHLIDIVGGEIPGPAGSIIAFIAKELFFPVEEVDVWSEIEGRVRILVDQRAEEIAEQVVNSRFGLAVMTRLRAFGDGFRHLLMIADDDRRELQLSLLCAQLDQLTAELSLIPPHLLPMVPSVLRPLALTHMALLQETRLRGSGYSHQAAINRAAIRYSDLAGKLFESFLIWRRAQIAEGKGTLVMEDLDPTRTHVLEGGKFRRVRMAYYDRYFGEHSQPGRGATVKVLVTPDLREDQPSPIFEDYRDQLYAHMRAYDEQVVARVTKEWEDELLSFTLSFMQFVDWPGVNAEREGRMLEFRAPRLTFPNHGRPHRRGVDPLARIDAFLAQQMDAFRVAGPRYLQTFRVMDTDPLGPDALLRLRADTYDNAMALIYLLQRGRDRRAAMLADSLALAVERDARGGGRIIATGMADRFLDPELGNTTSIHPHDGGNRDVGNASWTGIGLCRAYRRLGDARHLDAALALGHWIASECAVTDDWGGFSGGEDPWGNRRGWRSVEHNVDAQVLFALLAELTDDDHWRPHSESAARLVRACWLDAGYYCTGTGVGMTLNETVIPTDCQSWTGLTTIDPDRREQYLGWMNDNLRATSVGFDGFRFALAGAEVQNEATAGALMAMHLAGGSLRAAAEPLFDALLRQQDQAPNNDGLGLVATPADRADTGEGLGWSYFNMPHVAASAWTGLALLARDDPEANPYAVPG